MSSENSTLVKLNNAGFKQNDKWLVEGVSLTVKKGKIVTLIGPNGSGKSTTAKIALGIYKNIEGSVEKYTNKVGYVPQKISIDWTLPLRVYDFMLLTENIKDEAIDEALTLTGVIHLKNKNLGNLSGGEFQRVLIARAISKKPELLVLDEPVQGVDYTGEIALYELIKRILLRGEMTGRSDDTEDSIKVRFEVYKKDTQPLVDFYNEKNLVNVIDAVGEVDDIYNSISRHFNNDYI